MGINSQAQNSFGTHDLDILGANGGGISRKNVGEEENKIFVEWPSKTTGGRAGDCLTIARAFRPLSKISCVSVAESERSPGTPLLGAVGERHPEV